MLKWVAHSFYARTGAIVFTFHVLILVSIAKFGFWVVDTKPRLVLSGEIIELESAVVSKRVVMQSTVEKISPMKTTPIRRESSEGTEQVNKTQDSSAITAAAPISMPSADSKNLNNPKPPYPISSRENGDQGRVILNACINDRGDIDRLELAKSSGHSALDRSALNTVKHWKFIPAQQSGKPIAICYRLPVNFILSTE